MSNRRWKKRPEGSNWGEFGDDDQLGRVNLITPIQVLKGVKEVKEGKTFCLSLPLNIPGGNALNSRRSAPKLSPTKNGENTYVNFPLSKNTPQLMDVISDDYAQIYLQYSTQWDSLAHVGALFDSNNDGTLIPQYYNGYHAENNVVNLTLEDNEYHDSYAKKLGIETLAEHGMQGRAVLLDLVRVFGTSRNLIGYKEIIKALESLNITIEQGDMLVIRTGFSEELLKMNGKPDIEILNNFGAVLDGLDSDLLNWITESGISAICADNYAVEDTTKDSSMNCCYYLPLHHHCLFKLGLPLAELWYLKDLAEWLEANNRYRFLLTAPPLRLPGAVGSPVTPIATV